MFYTYLRIYMYIEACIFIFVCIFKADSDLYRIGE